jgi:hypothetical protein
VLADGYHVDDLHAAMREHQLARSEELEYERRQSSPRFKRIMRTLLGTSLVTSAIGGALIAKLADAHGASIHLAGASVGINGTWLLIIELVGLVTLTFSSVAVVGEYVRLNLANRLTSRAIAFWKSKWGARVAKAASLFLKKAERPTLGMPLLTEVALGRATDHLFEALPKASRRELAALPDTVRRLEADAGKLRNSIAKLDDQLAAFDRGGETLGADDERSLMANELRATRAVAVERLATTVSALEAIRLDLLRLQMGSAGLESVTASIEAAKRVGDQISEAVAAQEAVERILRETPAGGKRTLPSATPLKASDDADTPIDGTPAARG